MNKFYLILLAIVVAAAVWFFWPQSNPRGIPIPPRMNAAEITAIPDYQLISTVFTDLRFRLVLVNDSQLAKWRTMAEAPRNLLALSWVEDDLPPDAPVIHQFNGFDELITRPGANHPSFEDIAVAYEAIGAPKVAAVLRDAARIAGPDADGPSKDGGSVPILDPHKGMQTRADFNTVDAKFRYECAQADTHKLIRAYIRAHVDEIAAAKL
jgi:hypothetical protein